MYKRIFSISHPKYFSSSVKMPKNKKISAGEKSKDSTEKNTAQDTKGPVYLGKGNEIIMKIQAKPGAKESAITDISCESIGVQIGAPPLDGEANKELIRYLAEVLNLRKSDLSLDKGSRSKEKTVIISKEVSISNILESLHAVSKQK